MALRIGVIGLGDVSIVHINAIKMCIRDRW